MLSAVVLRPKFKALINIFIQNNYLSIRAINGISRAHFQGYLLQYRLGESRADLINKQPFCRSQPLAGENAPFAIIQMSYHLTLFYLL